MCEYLPQQFVHLSQQHLQLLRYWHLPVGFGLRGHLRDGLLSRCHSQSLHDLSWIVSDLRRFVPLKLHQLQTHFGQSLPFTQNVLGHLSQRFLRQPQHLQMLSMSCVKKMHCLQVQFLQFFGLLHQLRVRYLLPFVYSAVPDRLRRQPVQKYLEQQLQRLRPGLRHLQRSDLLFLHLLLPDFLPPDQLHRRILSDLLPHPGVHPDRHYLPDLRPHVQDLQWSSGQSVCRLRHELLFL